MESRKELSQTFEPAYGFWSFTGEMRRRLSAGAFFAVIFFIYYRYSRIDSMRAPRSRETNLSSYTKTIFLPYTKEFRPERMPHVKMTINGKEIGMPVDTGSTGLLMGAPLLPDIDPEEGTPAYHFFSSSKILYNGRFVNLNVTFHGSKGSYAVARVPVFVVDKSFLCPWYEPDKHAFSCPLGPEGEEPTPRDTSQITYMGVGFGRNRPGGGQPGAGPTKNPFLNIRSINGERVSHRSLRPGYTVSTRGVHLGLTKNNTRGFSFMKLKRGVTYDDDSRDWAMPRMHFSIDGMGSNCGHGLVDTGVAQMYIRAEEGVSIPTVIIPNPNPEGRANEVERVMPGSKIAIGFPSLDENRVAGYSFVVGEGSSMEPTYVVPGKVTPPTYLNTGRNFLFGYSIAFDAVGGRFGFRPVS